MRSRCLMEYTLHCSIFLSFCIHVALWCCHRNQPRPRESEFHSIHSRHSLMGHKGSSCIVHVHSTLQRAATSFFSTFHCNFVACRLPKKGAATSMSHAPQLPNEFPSILISRDLNKYPGKQCPASHPTRMHLKRC